ncbi:hypothetical protein D3C74_329150 [compost metagenome]
MPLPTSLVTITSVPGKSSIAAISCSISRASTLSEVSCPSPAPRSTFDSHRVRQSTSTIGLATSDADFSPVITGCSLSSYSRLARPSGASCVVQANPLCSRWRRCRLIRAFISSSNACAVATYPADFACFITQRSANVLLPLRAPPVTRIFIVRSPRYPRHALHLRRLRSQTSPSRPRCGKPRR